MITLSEWDYGIIGLNCNTEIKDELHTTFLSVSISFSFFKLFLLTPRLQLIRPLKRNPDNWSASLPDWGDLASAPQVP